jgi:heme o synthase
MPYASSAAIPARLHNPPRLVGRRATAATLRALLVLTKPRLAAMSVFTTVLAYLVAPYAGGGLRFAFLFLGTALSAGGALALNQWYERDSDARMRRTRGRPLPAGELGSALALGWSLALAIVGVAILALLVNPLAATLSAATIVLYAWIYTPLKRRTRWATEIGAIAGALPPLIGWAAAEGRITAFGWLLFALLYFWQMPHFFAIGWLHRRDYCAAGFPLLPAVDRDGARTARWSLAYTAALLLVSLAPVALGFAGLLFGAAAATAGSVLAWRAWRMVRDDQDRDAAARRLFTASIIYLPLLLAALAADRLV